VAAFSRFLNPEDTAPSDRRDQLSYLRDRDITEGPASGDTFFTYANSLSTASGFVSTFESFVTDSGADVGGVMTDFQSAATSAVGNYDSDTTAMDELIDLLEAGIRAAQAEREARIDGLNNDFDDTGARTDAGLLQQFYDDASTGPATGDRSDLFSDLDERPIALLPVGLETKFVGDELRVRIYPDDVHVDAHEPELTPNEERWGQIFWTQVYLGRFRGEQTTLPQNLQTKIEGKLPDVDYLRDLVERTLFPTGGPPGTGAFSDGVHDRYTEIKERAWGQLVERLERERATFVVRRTAPVDRSDSSEPETARKILLGPPPITNGSAEQTNGLIDELEFPDPPYRPGAWTRQPRARFLPDRFAVHLTWETEVGFQTSDTVVADNAVREPLYLGPNPESVELSRSNADQPGSSDGADPGLPQNATDAVDDGMEWMVDFEAAERAGMAVRISENDLDVASLPDRFSRVVVTGIDLSTGDASDALSELLEAHHYTRGLELLPGGTRTNNHEGGSGYTRSDDPAESRQVEVGPPLTHRTDLGDGNLLAQCLGVHPGQDERHVFAHVDGADDTEYVDAWHLQSVLWPGTLGYTLRHLFAPTDLLDPPYTDSLEKSAADLVTGIRDHFVKYVRGDGPFPALRVGTQPYGILPATSLDRHPDESNRPSGSDDIYWELLRMVERLREHWEASVDNVPTVIGSQARRQSTRPDAGEEDGDSEDSGNDSNGEGSQGVTPLERSLRREAVSHTYERRRFYVEDSDGRHAQVTQKLAQAFSENDYHFQPRLFRLLYFDFQYIWMERDQIRQTVGHFNDYYQAYTRSSGMIEHSPVTSPVVPSSDFLSILTEISTGDLARLGFDLHVEEFQDLFTEIYIEAGAASSWNDLEGMLTVSWSDFLTDLETWLNDGDPPPRFTLLRAAIDTDNRFYFANESADLNQEGFASTVLEDVVGTSSDSHEDNLTALSLLVVQAMDELLASGGLDLPYYPKGAPRRTEYLNVMTTDGHDKTLGEVERYSISDYVEDRITLTRREYPQGVTAYPGLFTAMEDAARSNLGQANDAFDAARDFLVNVTFNHDDEVVLLALTFRGEKDYRKVGLTTFREESYSVVPTDIEEVPLSAKVARDTSLFNLILWHSVINANLNVIPRQDDHWVDDYLDGDQRSITHGTTLYELLNERPPDEVMEAYGWSTEYRRVNHRHHPIITDYGADNWFGMLDLMRGYEYIAHDASDDRLAAFYASLECMDQDGFLDPANVDATRRLFASTMDVASHRLDAWWTSLATRRLMEIRRGSNGAFDLDLGEAWTDIADAEDDTRYELDRDAIQLDPPGGATETYVGAYGFVEDLVRGDATTANPDFPETEYLQAPSVTKATTAAILRSGYRSHPSDDYGNTLDLDLSPERVQMGQWVLEGLRAGLWLGELLGYYFERRLHELSQEQLNTNLEEYIADFRAYAPMSEEKIDRGDSEGSLGTKADMLDGYTLYDDASRNTPDDIYDEVGVDHSDRGTITDVIEELAGIVDAVADLIAAENVHQVRQGNFSQAGRSLQALAEGKPPRDPDFVEINRESTQVTHRVLALFGLGQSGTGEDVSPPSVWDRQQSLTTPKIQNGSLVTAADGTPETETAEYVVRDEGAPVLNAFAGRVFPDPNRIQCVATYRWTEGSGETATEREHPTSVLLADLELSPMDALFLTQQNRKAGASKIENHVAYHLLRNRPNDGIPTDAEVEVEFATLPGSAGDDALSIGDFVELSRSLRDLVLESRAADATDLSHPGDGSDRERVDPGVVGGRADTASQDLEAVRDVLQNRLEVFGGGQDGGSSAPSTAGLEDLTEPVVAVDDLLAEFGEHAHVPSVAEEADHLDGEALLSELQRLHDALPAGPADPEAIEAEMVLDPSRTTVEGQISFVDEVDAYVPPVDVTIRGTVPSGETVSEVRVGGVGGGRILAEVGVTQQGTTFSADVEFDTLVEAGTFGRRLRVWTDEETASITSLDPSYPSGQSLSKPEVTVAVAPTAVAKDFGSGSPVVDIRVESHSPSSRVSAGKDDVRVGHHGNFSATVDLSGATPGTALQVVAVHPHDDDVIFAADGRVARPSGQEGVDGSLVDDETVLPRLLWLDGIANRYQPYRIAGMTMLAGNLGNHHSASAAIGTVGASPQTVAGAVSATSSPAEGSDRGGTTGQYVETVESGFDIETIEPIREEEDRTVDHGTVVNLANDQDYRESIAAGEIAIDDSAIADAEISGTDSGGSGSGDGGGSSGSGGGTNGGLLASPGAVSDMVLDPNFVQPSLAGGSGGGKMASPGVIQWELTLAGELMEALEAVDWVAVTREAGLFPDTRTTFDTADDEAVTALQALEDVDIEALSEALTGTSDPRGVVTTIRKLGLPGAFTMVGTDNPFGHTDQTVYSNASGDRLGDLRARVGAFLDDPWPDKVRWHSDELFLIDPRTVAFVDRQDLRSSFATLVGLTSDPEWSVDTLAGLLKRPDTFVRRVNDFLYAPENVNDYGELGRQLRAVATAVGGSGAAADQVREFEAVEDPNADFATPLTNLGRAVGNYDPATTTPLEQKGRSHFVSEFDDAATTVDDDVDLLADAYEGRSVVDAFREGLLETLRRPMVRAAYFGIYGAMPAEPTGGSTAITESLLEQAESTLGAVRERLDEENSVSESDPLETERQRLRAIFGDDYRTLPPFTPVNLTEVRRTFGNQTGLLDHDDAGPLPVQTWFQRSARVRDPPRRLRETLTYAEAVTDGDFLDLDVGQLPHIPDDDWVGLDGVRPGGNDRVSIVAHTDGEFDTLLGSGHTGDEAMAGIFVDEWVEEVPEEEETTAVAFRYDDPSNRPPQSILLATPPKKGSGATPWTPEDLHRTVEETMDAMKYRGVDLEALNPPDDSDAALLGQLLSALHMPQDTYTQPDHPSIDYTPLDRYQEWYVRSLQRMGQLHGGLTLGNMDVQNMGQMNMYDGSGFP